MALLDQLGVGDLGNINVVGILGGVGQFFVLVLMFLFIAGVLFIILQMRKNKELYNKKVHWFEEVNGQIVPIDTDMAGELTVPGSNIQVFYIKKKDLYLPRPVKRMGKDSYWFCVKNNREIVNFTLKNINKEMDEANLDYDHTDMRYALTNLKELIKRNYRDKSQPWWREYKDVISLVVLIFVMSLSFFFLISQIGKLLDQAATIIDHSEEILRAAQSLRGSGIAAGG